MLKKNYMRGNFSFISVRHISSHQLRGLLLQLGERRRQRHAAEVAPADGLRAARERDGTQHRLEGLSQHPFAQRVPRRGAVRPDVRLAEHEQPVDVDGPGRARQRLAVDARRASDAELAVRRRRERRDERLRKTGGG